jgi:hypothetical protein
MTNREDMTQRGKKSWKKETEKGEILREKWEERQGKE